MPPSMPNSSALSWYITPTRPIWMMPSCFWTSIQ
jgi:hypothetical protein